MSTVNYGFFYTNGMMADDATARQVKESIQSIIRKDCRLNSRSHVTVQSNYATPTDRVTRDVALGLFGTMCIVYAVRQKRKDEFTAAVLSVGVLALGLALYDYKKMQDDKNEIALALAKKVEKFLTKDRSRIATLILHSQGADVGYRALQKLEGTGFSRRINVITLGAMTTLPEGMCANVQNFKFKNDKISRIVAYPFETMSCTKDTRRRKVIDLKGDGSFNTHGVNEYLKKPEVREAICQLGSAIPSKK